MKRLYRERAATAAAALVVVAAFSAAFSSSVANAECTNPQYALIQVNSGDAFADVVDTTNDKPALVQTSPINGDITMTATSGKCGVAGGGFDGSYPTSGTYRAVTTMMLSSNNSKPTRMPDLTFVKTPVPALATLWTKAELAQASSTVPCDLVDSNGDTSKFYRVRFCE